MASKPALRVKKMPLILKKGSISILKGIQNREGTNISNILPAFCKYKEEVLLDTTDMYFLKGKYQKMTLIHRLNLVTKGGCTIAKYVNIDGSVLEKTSDRVTQVIGQEQYNTIFTALCSIIDQELKIRSLVALLTVKPAVEINLEDTNKKNETPPKSFVDKYTQTHEIRIEPLKRVRKRARKPIGPYVIQDFKAPEPKKTKRVIVNFKRNSIDQTDSNDSDSSLLTISDKVSVSSNDKLKEKTVSNIGSQSKLTRTVVESLVKSVQRNRNSTDSLPDLGHLHDEYSNDSIGKFSALSDTPTLPELLTNPNAFFQNVDKHTKEAYVDNYIVQPNFKVRHMDGTDIMLPYKPEDVFHIATKENLQYLDEFSRKKLLSHQMMIDYKHCLTVMDEDGNLPIHLAVLNNDVELLKRHCVVLKIRGSSLDLLANGLTALKLALHQTPPHNAELSATLVRHGACPLRAGLDSRACAHDAAERDGDLLKAVLAACSGNARRILSENEELWKPDMEKWTDDELAQCLMRHICSTFDKQGYTPLMIACRLGLYENVRILLEHSPSVVNEKMPTSGNTALYLAVAAACNSSSQSGNKSKVLDHFRKTIEVLLENGADPSIDNHSGTNVNTLLTEFNCAELSMLVANKLTVANFTKNEMPETTDACDKIMYIKNENGEMEIRPLDVEKKTHVPDTNLTDIRKPVIVQNILLKSVGRVNKSRSLLKAPVSPKTPVLKLQQIALKTPINHGKLKRKVEAPKSQTSSTTKQKKIDK